MENIFNIIILQYITYNNYLNSVGTFQIAKQTLTLARAIDTCSVKQSREKS